MTCKIMCNVCWKEFKGWCRSFTRVEICLSLVQALLLSILIAFLTFLTLHFLACHDDTSKLLETTVTFSPQTDESETETEQFKKISSPQSKTPVEMSSSPPETFTSPSTLNTERILKDVECTWIPSKKTKATTHYYLTERVQLTETTYNADISNELLQNLQTSYHAIEENRDGDEATTKYKNYVAALVKLEPSAKLIFGCILTKVTRYWTLTAGSCIESIEEVDSLDSFFIMDSFGESTQGQIHVVADVQIHPLYQGANYSYDLAALRSDDALASSTIHLLRLPTILDFFLVSIGERFIILGYGAYRTVEADAYERRLRQVAAYTVSGSQCSDVADTWAPRHLVRGGPLVAGACGPAALCAGALYARDEPCSYCGGTPLLRAGILYGVMSDNRQCGVVCEPAHYVNVAALRDWIHYVVF